MKKIPCDCAFQYYIGVRCIEDTGLITREEAEELWEKHKPHFIKICEEKNEYSEDAEMALWIDMRNEINYHKTAKRVHSSDVIMKNGVGYEMVRVL
jgi:hypothetical protein